MELKKSNDGSHTLFVPELNEHYHSIHGAYNESQHVFIEAGLNEIQKNEFKIFEVGFGTGLNAYLTLNWTKNKHCSIQYHSIEKFPVPLEIVEQLNYPELVDGDSADFRKLHDCEWNQQQKITPQFFLNKIHDDLTTYRHQHKYDLIFFDAFAPEKQEEMWHENIFTQLFESLNEGGLLTTYCAKGIIKRRLKSVGFQVDSIPGPPGKREMIRAIKP